VISPQIKSLNYESLTSKNNCYNINRPLTNHKSTKSSTKLKRKSFWRDDLYNYYQKSFHIPTRDCGFDLSPFTKPNKTVYIPPTEKTKNIQGDTPQTQVMQYHPLSIPLQTFAHQSKTLTTFHFNNKCFYIYKNPSNSIDRYYTQRLHGG
jgi:hypothetical protein